MPQSNEHKESTDTEAMRRMMEKATQGPFTDGGKYDDFDELCGVRAYTECGCRGYFMSGDDEDLLIAMRNALPGLLADLEETRAEVERLRGELLSSKALLDAALRRVDIKENERLREENEAMRKVMDSVEVHVSRAESHPVVAIAFGHVRKALKTIRAALKSKETTDGE